MAGLDKATDEFGIKGYEVDPNLRFNFNNKQFKIPGTKKNTYIDEIFEKQGKLPSSSTYECNAHRMQFCNPKKLSKIYTTERKSSWDKLQKEEKEKPGVGKYETTAFYEKRIKPPRGLHKVSMERISTVDEVQWHAKQIPDKYPDVPMDRYKPRPFQ